MVMILITSLVMGYDQEAIDKDRAEWESPITKQYGNFFVIEMENKAKGKWYMLNGTDLENPIVQLRKLWAFPELTQLNNVDFPTLGSPTIPHLSAIFFYSLYQFQLARHPSALQRVD